jgi:hypothetical protein
VNPVGSYFSDVYVIDLRLFPRFVRVFLLLLLAVGNETLSKSLGSFVVHYLFYTNGLLMFVHLFCFAHD